MAERFYSDDEAQEILRIAARTSIGSGSISSNELRQTAAELGIRPEDVAQAEAEFYQRQELESDRRAFREHKRKEFMREVSQWLSGAVLLYGIALVSRGFDFHGLWATWPKWPVGFWTLFLAKDAVEHCVDMTVNRETSFEKWRQKQAKKAERKSQKEAEAMVAPTVAELDASPVDRNQVRS